MLELSQKLMQLGCQYLEPSLSNEVGYSQNLNLNKMLKMHYFLGKDSVENIIYLSDDEDIDQAPGHPKSTRHL